MFILYFIIKVPTFSVRSISITNLFPLSLSVSVPFFIPSSLPKWCHRTSIQYSSHLQVLFSLFTSFYVTHFHLFVSFCKKSGEGNIRKKTLKACWVDLILQIRNFSISFLSPLKNLVLTIKVDAHKTDKVLQSSNRKV